MIVEGQRVTYAGDSDPFQEVGSLGKVLALSGDAAHIQWHSGPKQGQVDLVQCYELLPARQAATQSPTTVLAAFDDSLDMPGAPAIQVRAVYDAYGEPGLVNALSEAGHLAVLSEYVDEAVGHLASRVRQDPAMSGVLASLEGDEADNLVARVASLLLADRLTEEG